MLVIVSSFEKSEYEGFPEIKKLADKAIAKGYKVYGVSASFAEIIQLQRINISFLLSFYSVMKLL